MNHYRYTLDNTRPVRLYTCPACSRKALKRYLDHESQEYLPEHVGRCNREEKCGYHLTAIQYFQNIGQALLPTTKPRAIASLKRPSFIPDPIFQLSFASSQANNFLTFLYNRFGNSISDAAKQRFRIGTSKHWPGATCFWQVDENMKVRTGKVMLYDENTGHRVKVPTNHIDWAHSLLMKQNQLEMPFHLDQCLFGLHQLATQEVKEISIVESEKTAIIASILLPETTWMASGGLSMLSSVRLTRIKRYPIVLYPDLNCYDKWDTIATKLRKDGFRVTVSDLLEKAEFVTLQERETGCDLADYLLKLPHSMTDLQKLENQYPCVIDLVRRFGLEVINMN